MNHRNDNFGDNHHQNAATAFEPAGEWAAELAELAERRAQAHAMGGPEALAKFRASGRMNARERADDALPVVAVFAGLFCGSRAGIPRARE